MAPEDFDVIVTGAGAAGLFCAMHAGRRGRRTVVLEHNAEPGRKILISGGGRCNFTNRDMHPHCFLSRNAHFAKSALARYTPADFLGLITRHGIAWHEKKHGQLFCDGSARQVLDMLLAECREAGVELRTGTRIGAVRRPGLFEIETSGGVLRAPALVVASGGMSIPKLGATGWAYELAHQFGLRVVPPAPALVPLVFSPDDRRRWSTLAGVSTEVRGSVDSQSFQEKLLFTHRGLSGPAILQISSYWHSGAPLALDLAPGRRFGDELVERKRHGERRAPRAVLGELLPARLAARWLELHPVPEGPLEQAPDAALRLLGDSLQSWTVFPSGTEGFEKAEVTSGGVETDELSSRSMEARRVPGLYFIGECVDVTGWLGGYNFQWAWSSAWAAAQAV